MGEARAPEAGLCAEPRAEAARHGGGGEVGSRFGCSLAQIEKVRCAEVEPPGGPSSRIQESERLGRSLVLQPERRRGRTRRATARAEGPGPCGTKKKSGPKPAP